LSSLELLSVDSLESLSSIVVDVVNFGVIAEALLLNTFSETMSIESGSGALFTVIGMLELEVTELESLFEWDFGTVV
jgi:hypothetical protein